MQFSFLLINLKIKEETLEWGRGVERGDSTMFVARCSCFNFDLSTQCATYLIEQLLQQRQELTNCGASAIGHHKSHVAASAETLLQLQLQLQLDPWLGSACLQLQLWRRLRLRVGRMPRRLRRWWQSQNVRPAVIVHAKRQRWSLPRSLLPALCTRVHLRSKSNKEREKLTAWMQSELEAAGKTATTTTTKLYRCERCIRRCCYCCCCRPNRVRLAINPRCETMSVCVQVCCCCCCCAAFVVAGQLQVLSFIMMLTFLWPTTK